ncbi:unnamed protein product [Calypogeia fissa]
MEILVSRRSTDGRSAASLEEKIQPRRVVVALDATMELKLTALRYALENLVRPGDNLSLLGILHPFFCSVGYEQQEGSPKLDGNVKSITQEGLWKKHAEFQKIIIEKEIYKLVDLKKVIFDIHIATGPDRKLVMAKQAMDLQPLWVILDQDLKDDKAYLMKQLNCNVVLMKSMCEATIIKLELAQAENPNLQEWKKRWKTAVGTARALRYLHEECDVGCIVHRDVDNISVTYDVVPMLGVFAHASSSQPSGDELKETRCMGMRGFLAPEYAEPGIVTPKADVYSFGVLLLQLITGRRAIDSTKPDGETSLTDWVRPLIEAGKAMDLLDPRLRSVCDIAQATKMVEAAARCISMDSSQRPDMNEVLGILERDTNLVSSISIGSSTNDVSDILRDPSTKCLLQTNLITFQTNLITLQGNLDDSVQSEGKGVAPNSNSNGTPHLSHPSNSHRQRDAEGDVATLGKMTGIRKPPTRKVTSQSSNGKSSRSRSGSGKPKTKLSYREMLI